jgi:hypothetical protein
MTIAEIKSEAEKTPALKSEIFSSFKDEFLKGVQAEGMIVRSKDDDQKFLDNHVKTVVDGKVAEQLKEKVAVEYGKSMGEIDTFLKEITGVEKNNGEKTTAYAKRALEAIKAKGGDPVTKAKVEELEKILETKESEYKQKISDLETASFKQMIDFELNSDLDKRNYPVPAHLKTDEEKQKFVAEEKEMIKGNYLSRFTTKKDNDGNIVFYEGDKPLMSQKDGKPMKAGEIISERYAHRFVPTGHVQTGTGTGQQGGGAASGFKTKDDVHKHLAAQGIEAGTKEYMDQYSQLVTDNKLQ